MSLFGVKGKVFPTAWKTDEIPGYLSLAPQDRLIGWIQVLKLYPRSEPLLNIPFLGNICNILITSPIQFPLRFLIAVGLSI